MTTIKIHYHSDCRFFAGCENMLANFFNSPEYQKNYAITFSFVDSAMYRQGFGRRVTLPIQTFPLRFVDLSSHSQLIVRLPIFFKSIFLAVIRIFLTLPVLFYQAYILYRLFKKINPDILHINNGGYPAALSARSAAIAGKLVGIKLVLMVVNNMAVDYSHYSRWLDYPVDRIVVKCVHLFITGSKAAQSRISRVLSLPPSQSLAIHNGIKPRHLTSSDINTRKRLGLDGFKGIVFGVVAHLIPRKGHQVLLEAVLHLVSEKNFLRDEFKIIIEGEGPLHQDLVNFVFSNNLTPWVIFIGVEENIFNFMAALDVLVLPSIQDEDFPNVIVEGMSLGKPAIASYLAGIPEQILDGKTGFLFKVGDCEGLAKALYYFIENPSQVKIMGQAAVGRFKEKFTSKISLKNYNDLYKSFFYKASSFKLEKLS